MIHYQTRICKKSIKGQKSLKNQWNFIDKKTTIFQYSKHYGSPTRVTRIKVADTISIKDLDNWKLLTWFYYENSTFPLSNHVLTVWVYPLTFWSLRFLYELKAYI